MKRKHVGCLLVMVMGWAQLEAEVDSRERTFVAPVRIVWQSSEADKRSGVTGADSLLAAKHGQVPELGWDKVADGCALENDGKSSGILLDFGRELHGGVRIGFGTGTRRSRLRIRFGESVAEAMSEVGEKGATNDHAVRDDVVEAPVFGSLEFGQTGFRFVRLDLVTPGRVVLQSVRAVSLMRPMKRIGSFRCSDERLNAIFETAVRSVHLCCQDRLWDGIKRDRLVWMGDTHPETMTVLSVFGAASVLPETLDYARDTTPVGTWMNRMPTYTLWWIRNVAEWYRFTGDRSFLGRHADYLEQTFDFVLTAFDEECRWTKDAFLDWPTRHNKEAEAAGVQALALIAAREAGFLVEALGRTEFARKARTLVERLGTAKPDPAGEKSAAALLALSGLRDPGEMFREVLGKRGCAGVSTFYGYYMLEAMSAANEHRHALDTVREYWGAMLDVGATSFWEDFNLAWTNNCFRIDELPVAGKNDIHGDFGEFCYKGFRHSLCHGWSSGPAVWCIRNILGIRPIEVGCKAVVVRPNLCDLDWAEGALALPDGSSVRVKVVRNDKGNADVHIDAPEWVRVTR